MATTSSKAAALPREAYPNAILFVEEQDSIYWLHGPDLMRFEQVLGLCWPEEEDSIGFDGESAGYYIKALLEQGEQVGILRGTTVQPIVLRGSGDPTKVKSTAIGLAPELIFGLRELERLSTSLTRKHSPLKETVERLRLELAKGNSQAITEVGTIYVIQVDTDLYEVEPELTTMPQSVVEALAVAAHLAGKMLRCQLVAPKPRRGRKGASPKPAIVVHEPIQYGQLRLTF